VNSQVGITRAFRDRLHRLDGQIQTEIWDAVTKVMDGNGSTHVHKLEGSGYVAFGVNRNALRVICLREQGTLLLVHVDAHDRAYAWASRNRAVRVGSVVRIVAMDVEHVDEGDEGDEGATPPGAQPGVVAAPGPLAHVRDRLFANFQVSAGFAEVLRRVPSDDALIELAEHITPPPLADALLELATDPDAADQAVLRYHNALRSLAAEGPRQASLADALADPLNAATMIALPPGEQALQAALRGDLDDWRLFLHPSQQRMVRWRGSGAIKLTGGPGTGKTVVALHRARYLARERFAADPRPVLLTTFGGTLAEQLRELVARLCADQPELRDRIEVLTLTGAAQRVLRDAGRPAALLLSNELDPCWKAALEHERRGWSRASYEAEREHVVAVFDAWTEAEYLRAKRPGRSVRLDRSGRHEVWAVLAAFEQALAARGGADAIGLARDAAQAVLTGAHPSPWSAVVCDEVQDASPSDLRLLGALTRDPETDQTRADALFLCGDGYQRLYRRAVPLSRCGVDVRGRSRTLRLNYRTTEGIRRAAVDFIRGVEIDDLDAVADSELSVLQGYRSVRGGPSPAVRSFASEDAEADWIAELGQDPAGSLLILARTRKYRDALAERLRDRGHAPVVLEGRGDLAATGITVCTLHRCKGLEAPRVVIAGQQLVPARWPGGDPADKAAWERQELCLVYVGMTRARDWCGVSTVRAG
jgi:superfamily I DNA/RNA helicase